MFSYLAMKKIRLIVIAATLMAVALSASAQTKIATVDVKKLFNSYYKTKQAQAVLDKDKADLTKELKDMADGLDKAKNDYKQLLDLANDQAISADEHAKRQQAAESKAKEINNSQAALQQFQRQAESKVSDDSQRMITNLYAEIQKYVAAKAKTDGYTLVVNSATAEVVVYSDPQVDITSAVIALENAGAPIDTALPPAPMVNISTNAP